MGFKGCAFADKVFGVHRCGIVCSAFGISDQWRIYGRIGAWTDRISCYKRGGPVMLPGISFRYIRHLRI